jgi:hypothetical protein
MCVPPVFLDLCFDCAFETCPSITTRDFHTSHATRTIPQSAATFAQLSDGGNDIGVRMPRAWVDLDAINTTCAGFTDRSCHLSPHTRSHTHSSRTKELTTCNRLAGVRLTELHAHEHARTGDPQCQQ